MPKPSKNTEFICSCCGAVVDIDAYVIRHRLFKRMKESSQCFACAFWHDIAENKKNGQEILNGHLYASKKGRNKKLYRHILKNDGTVTTLTDAWYYGAIPEHLQSILPDSGRLITQKAYRIIKDNPHFQCHSKGCWDRYHCYWYNVQNMEMDGPWNVVPAEHKIGDELCESFINKENMFIDEC